MQKRITSKVDLFGKDPLNKPPPSFLEALKKKRSDAAKKAWKTIRANKAAKAQQPKKPPKPFVPKKKPPEPPKKYRSIDDEGEYGG
jgi:hypothetical protein